MPKLLRRLKNYLFSLSLKQTLGLIFFVALLLLIPLTVYAVLTQRFDIRKQARERGIKKRLLAEAYIRQREPGNRRFKKLEIGKKNVYFHQRTIGEAIVEKDFINYQFDREKETFSKKTRSWRPDLPDKLPPLKITKEQAESMVTEEVKFSKLYIISPESDVFPLELTPENPCWVVSSIDENGIRRLTVIDAITGKELGDGVPFPSKGFSLSGPMFYSSECRAAWDAWYMNAYSWFEKMGYPTDAVEWPTTEEVRIHVQDPLTTLFYELAHGDSQEFINYCSAVDYGYWYIRASYIKTWLAERDQMSFAFIGSCDGMCETDENTFSYEFRKGSAEDSATVGYCFMDRPGCGDCWTYSILWQEAMFNYIYNGDTVKTAFDKALADYPMCRLPDDCVRFAGDENFKIVILPTPSSSPSPSPKPQPDLAVTNLEPSISDPYNLKIDYQISNQRQADAPATKTYFYIDGKYKFYDNDPEIPAGQSTLLLFYYGWSCTGESHEMKLCADGAGAVQESNEKNNCLAKILICPGPSPSPSSLPNLRMYDIKFYKPRTSTETTPKAGELVTAFAVMKNTGVKDTGVFNVKWFLNDEQTGYGSHANLPPDQESEGNVRFDWTPEVGTHYLRFSADVDSHVEESSEGDNQVVRQVVVK